MGAPPTVRIVGLETEFALGFQPASPGSPRPSQKDLFDALLRVLKSKHDSLEAAYYKGGEFLANGSLIHFEVSQLNDARVGLLEWATPECLGSREATVYVKAQEHALVEAIREAQADLGDKGFSGRLLLLKNNEDRYGNAYGSHESYDVKEGSRDLLGWIVAGILHPLVLAILAILALALAIPFIALFSAIALGIVAVQLLGSLPLLGRPMGALRAGLNAAVEFLVEASPTPGSGLLARASLAFLRVGGALFSLTASKLFFRAHLPALLPFLVTRPIFAGAGTLSPDGRFRLTPRAKLMRRVVGAFIYGRTRPLIDVKEYFYRRPLSFLRGRKRLHLLAGDSNRSEYAELLKLATTELVLDAIEADALGSLESVELLGGPLEAFRRVANDPTLETAVARDTVSGELLTALDVQRRTLEAVWRHAQSLPTVTPHIKDTLVRWNFVLDALRSDPRTLDRELDWVTKLKLMQAALAEALPEHPDPWGLLLAWGPVNERLEAKAPHLGLGTESTSDAVERAVRSSLGAFGFRAARRHVRDQGLEWGTLATARAAYLQLKAIDLRYHEVSAQGGYYDWLVRDGKIATVLDASEIARAGDAPPPKTRAAARARAVRRYAQSGERKVRAGWDKLVIDAQDGTELVVVRLDDPYDPDGCHALLADDSQREE